MRFFILLVILVVLSGCLQQPVPTSIKSFDDCVKAGYPVLESFPRQCKIPGGETFISLSDLFIAPTNISCTEDSDCVLVDKGLDFRCCWKGACEGINYSEDKWIGVNSGWFDGKREKYCPNTTECGPAPGCAVRAVDINYSAQCVNRSCLKVPILANISANLTLVSNTTLNETLPPSQNQSVENETQNLSGIIFGEGKYLLVLDDLSVSESKACALMSMYFASNQSLITKLNICPGEDVNWASPEGRVFRIKVTSTAAGYTANENWAKVIIYG